MKPTTAFATIVAVATLVLGILGWQISTVRSTAATRDRNVCSLTKILTRQLFILRQATEDGEVFRRSSTSSPEVRVYYRTVLPERRAQIQKVKNELDALGICQ